MLARNDFEAWEGAPMRVLIVDDSAMARTALRGMLDSEGFEVSEADNGAQVIEAADRVEVDLVLCDMLMPGYSGLQVIRELRRLWPGVKIIGMSAGRANGRADMLPTAIYVGA